MSYRTPVLSELATDVGVSCCTPCGAPPTPPPPSCTLGVQGILAITIDGFNCSSIVVTGIGH